MLQPVVRRTWAPRGQTPIHCSWDRRDRLSAISAITVSPERRQLGLYFDILNHNIVTDDFEMFVETILRRLQRSIILVVEGPFAFCDVFPSASRLSGCQPTPRISTPWSRSGTAQSTPTWPTTSPTTFSRSVARWLTRSGAHVPSTHCCDRSSVTVDSDCRSFICLCKDHSCRHEAL